MRSPYLLNGNERPSFARYAGWLVTGLIVCGASFEIGRVFCYIARSITNVFWVDERVMMEELWRFRDGQFLARNGYPRFCHRQLSDPDHREYYRRLHKVIAGNLTDTDRLKEICLFNLGRYDYLIDRYSRRISAKQ